jgi:hypothetical protein
MYGHEMTVRRAQATVTEFSETVTASPLYGVAMLKIAMELKKADAKPLDELISGVLARMKLPEGEFRAYLSANGGLLRTIAAKRSF